MKILVLDIDGTITDDERRVNCKVIEVIRRLDIPIVLATGNIVCFASATARLIGTGGIVIAENGGVVKTSLDGKEYVLGDIVRCRRAFDLLKTHFKLEKLDSEYRGTEIAVRKNFNLDVARAILDGANLGVNMVDSRFAIHIKDKRIDKGTGLKKVVELLGWSTEDVIAIGDAENDVEMLQTAGLGIAVGNADQKLKTVADFVMEGKYGAGVIEAVERFIN
ncbi:MAG: phosphoglycolate phosphatase [Methanosarcinales archaeon Met12]|nr:MAG: phosphoglycolate phosphatase [Methanosarcinales archaeon Met12]